MADDSLLELVNSAIATLIEVKQRLEEGEGIADKPQSSDGWKPVDFFDNMPGPVTSEEMQKAQESQSSAPQQPAYTPPQEPINTAQPQPKIQTRFCRNCGNELSPGSRFCRECGQPVE